MNTGDLCRSRQGKERQQTDVGEKPFTAPREEEDGMRWERGVRYLYLRKGGENARNCRLTGKGGENVVHKRGNFIDRWSFHKPWGGARDETWKICGMRILLDMLITYGGRI